MSYKIEVGNTAKAGLDAEKLQAIDGDTFETEQEAMDAVNAIAESWANPQGVWDMVSVISE